MTIDELQASLNSFDPKERKDALVSLKYSAPVSRDVSENVNMHFHSFYSYNSKGWSPSRIAWESHAAGLYAAGLCDFDVLDGQDEFLAAGRTLGLRTTVNLETRAFLKEYADSDINSPGEPGVAYIMGAGFATDLVEGSQQAKTLSFYRQKARQRNEDLIGRINDKLTQIVIDYENDVLPLTPSGSATERHIISAYLNKSIQCFPAAGDLNTFWSEIFELSAEETQELLNDRSNAEVAIRSKLAKRGGFGYIQPSEDTFPLVDDFIDWVRSCRAIPMTTWLDGTTNGESDARAMLECMRSKGAVALNIIPDRNWKIADAETKKVKLQNLCDIVAVAADMNIPINIGTEMNKDGQPLFDDLAGEELAQFRDEFVKGAQIMVGHTILLKYADFSYVDQKVQSHFADDPKAKNNFFASVGALPPLTETVAKRLQDAGFQKAFDIITDSASKGNWTIQA